MSGGHRCVEPGGSGAIDATEYKNTNQNPKTLYIYSYNIQHIYAYAPETIKLDHAV